MTRKLLLLLTLLLTLPLVSRAQVSVTGNLKDVGLSNITTNNAYVQFTLQNYGSNIPRVIGSSVIANPVTTFKPNGSGVFSGTIQPNDNLNPSGTYYRVCIFYQGNQFRCANYLLITGASFDLSTAAPLTSIPVVGLNQTIFQAFTCYVPVPTTTWTCTHNFNDIPVFTQVADLTGAQIFPDTTNTSDPNVATFTFVTPQAGAALISHAGALALTTTQPNAVLQNPSAGQVIQGPHLEVISSTAFTGPLSAANLNNVVFADQQAGTDACAKINTAIGLLPATGGIVNANGFLSTPQTCASNPFAGFATKPVQLLLCGTITTTAMWTLEEGQSVVGCGRDGARIKANAAFDFTTNKAVVRIGSSAAVDGARFENLRVDCNSVGNAVGVYSAWAQEQSGLRGVLTINCPLHGIWMETSGVQNSSIEESEVLDPAGASSASTIPVLLDGVVSFRGIHGLSIVETGSLGVLVGLRMNGVSGGTYENIHLEAVVTGVDIGPTVASDGFVLNNIYGNATITNLVLVNNTVTNLGVLTNLSTNGGTNSVNDAQNSLTLTDTRVNAYFIGSASVPSQWITGGDLLVQGAHQIHSKNAAGTVHTVFGAEAFAAGQGSIGTISNHPFRIYSNNTLAATVTTTQDLAVVGGLSAASLFGPFTTWTNGKGLQLLNTTTTCTTGASIGATCTTGAITLPVAEADTAYRVVCTGKGLTNVPVVIATTNSSASQFTITIAALTAAAASFASYDCTIGHN